MDSTWDHFPGLPSLAQAACYAPWLKVEVALRWLVTAGWRTGEWPEIRQNIPWLLAERSRFRREGLFN